ncbi:helix-turn-helix transcriptional regulator [Parapedobacter tibetensis]|uniref:helix-turn-helix transcriptional regulator n=1 Tax=Parapedobacter tibetensis TaxID=2972951 RepID=UPI00214DCF99|nr:helix-turn-helix transcriptional regulator [Parapedobacter tibetensis]
MEYRIIAPPLVLTPYVQYFWSLESNGDPQRNVAFTTVADGSPGLIFQQIDGVQAQQGERNLPTAYIYGQSVKPTQIAMSARFRTVGIFFFPNALQAIFGLDAHELTDGCVDLCLLDSFKGKALVECLLNTGRMDARVALLGDYLYECVLRNQAKQDAEAVYAMKQIQRADGLLSLRELRGDLRISERGIERKFQQAVGIAPKLFSRICQFQSALEHIRTGRFDSLTEVAFAHGYADQSHFIRTFRAFTDLSPKQYRKTLIETLPNFPQRIG